MRKLYVVGENDTADERDAECRAVLRLNVGLSELRIVGNLANQDRADFHSIEAGANNKMSYQGLLRGDDTVGIPKSTLFVTNSDDPNGNAPSSLVLGGLSLKALEAEADRFFNSTRPKPEMTSIVSALTVDGRGGHFTYDEYGFSACMLYYLENMYAATTQPMVDRIELERIGFRDQSGFIRPHAPLIPAQRASFEEWLYGFYLPAVAEAPTRRPITEQYYRQLKTRGLGQGEEKDIGEDFFTDYIWKILEKKQGEILKIVRSA